MSWSTPTVAEFKSFFARDFNFAPATNPNDLDFIIDADITRAYNEALINFNISLYGSEANITNVFMYLAAFCLVRNLQNSAKGLTSQAKFPVTSNSVGSVSVSYQVPEVYSKDPYISSFTQNGYGMRYLELTLPLLIGNVMLIEGATT